MLPEIKHHMVNAVQKHSLSTKLQEPSNLSNRKAAKLVIFSGHDSTISPLLSAFRVFDRTYPGFGSLVTFELFAKKLQDESRMQGSNISKESSSNAALPHYVRMLRDGKSLKIPACSGNGNHLPVHPEFCTLDAFMAHVDMMTPRNYAKECQF